ncbi:MAG: TonB-dependent receptor plug domain-containing protein [Cytophagales bacterium]|nr:TonB-dependent receptor plug domain-containing protein [Cytophagales bacterium]
MIRTSIAAILIAFASASAFSQYATLSGKVTNHAGKPVEFATIAIEGSAKGTITNASGEFKIKIPADRDISCIIRYVGFKDHLIRINLKENEEYYQEVILQKDVKYLKEVEVTGEMPDDKRREVSIIKIDPRIPKLVPSPFGDFTRILATLPGVVTASELSSTYSVRGGNYDENLVYVNDIEIYRPFLIRSGQQEGLSFVNPDMAADIEFSSGGWQAKYGDKLSSVLNIKYKEPKKFAGSVTLGLLGGSIHLEGASKNQRFSYLVGLRQKNSQYLLKTLPVKGDYKPKFTDIQTWLNFDLTRRTSPPEKEKRGIGETERRKTKQFTDSVRNNGGVGFRGAVRGASTTLGILASYARNRYLVQPSEQETTFGTFNRVLRLFVAFDGQELMQFDTYQGGLKLSRRFKKGKIDLIASVMNTREREFLDVESGYRLCQVGTEFGKKDFNKCVSTIGIGTNFNHARNTLLATVASFEHKGLLYNANARNSVEWGIKYSKEIIHDELFEYSFADSSDFVIDLQSTKTSIDLNTNRLSSFIQYNFKIDPSKTLNFGYRLSIWDFNNQLLFSPRIQYSWKPKWEKDVVFRSAIGIYQQPPFYRELRDKDGMINDSLKAQTSVHTVFGSDMNFKAWGRDFKLVSEAYFKYIYNVIPYDIDNVKIRYFANNNAKAYAAGLDFRVSGEFIKGAQSWFSLGYLTTKEDIEGDYYDVYYDSTGEEINPNLDGYDKVAYMDSLQPGYIRRSTDQRLTVGIFFQDHIPNNPSIKMYLNLVFGTGLPFGPPGSKRYRNFATAPRYQRVDIGFSKLIKFYDKGVDRKKRIESIWLGLEILNLLGYNNTISHTWVEDVYNTKWAVPNHLSARFFNLRIIAKF